MIIPDVNLLLYAEIDGFTQHIAARRWWESSLRNERVIGLPFPSLFGFLRIATSRRVFADPMTVEDAIARIRNWLSASHVRVLMPGPHHLDIAFGLLSELGTGGNMTTDVQLAAHAIEHQADLYSNDRVFGRFAGLRWKNPLEP